MTRKIIMLSLAGLGLTACSTTPEPVEQTVFIPPPEVNTCTPISAAQRVVIPAETKTVIAITEIANPPYEPIQRREEQTRVVKPEQVIYVDSNGQEIVDLCDPDVTS